MSWTAGPPHPTTTCQLSARRAADARGEHAQPVVDGRAARRRQSRAKLSCVTQQRRAPRAGSPRWEHASSMPSARRTTPFSRSAVAALTPCAHRALPSCRHGGVAAARRSHPAARAGDLLTFSLALTVNYFSILTFTGPLSIGPMATLARSGTTDRPLVVGLAATLAISMRCGNCSPLLFAWSACLSRGTQCRSPVEVSRSASPRARATGCGRQSRLRLLAAAVDIRLQRCFWRDGVAARLCR